MLISPCRVVVDVAVAFPAHGYPELFVVKPCLYAPSHVMYVRGVVLLADAALLVLGEVGSSLLTVFTHLVGAAFRYTP